MKIYELRYSNTNTYLIEGETGRLLFDTGWAGSFPAFCKAMGEIGIPMQKIDFILVSHYHPDHMGIVQEIADEGATLLAAREQRGYLHAADGVFEKEKNKAFVPVRDEKVRFFDLEESRSILREIGLEGEVFHTPGHSDDSVSLWLDEGALFVGDLNPLYELELHEGTQIGKSWEKLLKLQPGTVYYGHARKALLKRSSKDGEGAGPQENGFQYALVSRIMKMIDKGYHIDKIRKKTGADPVFIEDVMRMYLTHQGIGVQGILDRIEIKKFAKSCLTWR